MSETIPVKLLPVRLDGERKPGVMQTSDGRFQIYGRNWRRNYGGSMVSLTLHSTRSGHPAVPQPNWTIWAADIWESDNPDHKLLRASGLLDVKFQSARSAFAALRLAAYS